MLSDFFSHDSLDLHFFKLKDSQDVNFKTSSIKFLINNNKSVNLTVCQGLRDSYN